MPLEPIPVRELEVAGALLPVARLVLIRKSTLENFDTGCVSVG